MLTAVELVHQSLGSRGKPIIILHGLFGSKRNWHSVATKLAENNRVVVPDLRNHGASPHSETMDYPNLACDLVAFIKRENLNQPIIIGHSLGGKIAMYLALKYSQQIDRLIIVDIAPVSYPHRFVVVLKALKNLPLNEIKSRDDADHHLSKTIMDPSLRQFLLQNLTFQNGQYQWRINLPALTKALPELAAFPSFKDFVRCNRPSLFIGGQNSNYMAEKFHSSILKYFPTANIKTIAGAGHWLHVQKTNELIALIEEFM